MDFYYLQKVTLIDYPGKIGCTLFTYGCNFKCPFCHNPELVIEKWDKKLTSNYTEEKVLEFLESRKGKLDAVTITGGEPLLWDNALLAFLRQIKQLGFLIKIDSNGSFPEVIDKYIKDEVVDYWAMDIKNSLDMYEKTAGVKIDIKKVKKSIDLIKNSGVEYELRTTVVPGLHTKGSIEEIGKLLKGSKKFYIQNLSAGKMINQDLGVEKGFDRKDLEVFKGILVKYINKVYIREN